VCSTNDAAVLLGLITLSGVALGVLTVSRWLGGQLAYRVTARTPSQVRVRWDGARLRGLSYRAVCRSSLW
jgi:hypothetical protein